MFLSTQAGTSLNTALLWALELASAWEINTVPFKSEGLCLAEPNSGDCHRGNESLGDLHLMHHNRGRAFQQVRRAQRPQHKTFPLSREHCPQTKKPESGTRVSHSLVGLGWQLAKDEFKLNQTFMSPCKAQEIGNWLYN